MEEQRILLVSTVVSSLESSGVDESLERVFEAAASMKSIVMTREDMFRDKNVLEDLVAKAKAKINLNTVKFM